MAATAQVTAEPMAVISHLGTLKVVLSQILAQFRQDGDPETHVNVLFKAHPHTWVHYKGDGFDPDATVLIEGITFDLAVDLGKRVSGIRDYAVAELKKRGFDCVSHPQVVERQGIEFNLKSKRAQAFVWVKAS